MAAPRAHLIACAREIALVYAAMTLVTLLTTYSRHPWLRDYGHLLLSAAFMAATLQMARRSPLGPASFGVELSGVLEPRCDSDGKPEPAARTLRRAALDLSSELGVACLCAAVIFPPFVLAFQVFHDVAHPFTWQIPESPADFLLGQILVVALPEEALFRGYFQTRLSELFPSTMRVLGAELSPAALVCQAALFALLHFAVGLDPSRLSVFFPGLFFGWLRALRGGIGAATWFHALSNVLSELLTRGYL